MLIIKALRKIYTPLFSLLLISVLSGCSYFPKNLFSHTNSQLQGEIYSQLIIPENSEITLSISPIDTLLSPKENVLNYQLYTKEANKVISFKINLLDDMLESSPQLGISVRVEKNEELIMMSGKITELPRDLSEKISLIVVPIK